MDIVGDDKYFVNYRHMYECIIGNWGALKKKTGRATLDKLAAATRDMPDWSREEKVAMYVTLVGEIDMDLIIPPALMKRLSDKGVTSVDDAGEGDAKIHWMVIVDAKPAKTKKGKDYLRVQCVGESGMQHRMFIWGWRPGSVKLSKYTGYLAEVEKSDFGLATVPWKMREIDL